MDDKPVPLFCDNQGTVFTVHNPYINHRSKHLDIRYYRCRQMIRDGLIDVIFCRNQLNLADFFTKSLEPTHFHTFKDLIMNSDQGMRNNWKEVGLEKFREAERQAHLRKEAAKGRNAE